MQLNGKLSFTQGFQKDYSRNLKDENIVIEHNKKVTNKIYKERKRTVNITLQHLN